jgi:hypothetical protein
MPISAPRAVAPLGAFVSARPGAYTFTGGAAGTSNTMGNNTLRAVPLYVLQRAVIDRIGANVTVAGDVGSILRTGLYRDSGDLYPGLLIPESVVNPIPGDAVATVERFPGSIRFPGTLAVVSTPDSAAVSVTGPIDLRIKARLDDWQPSQRMVLMSKYDVNANRSFLFCVEPGGDIVLFWSTNGVAFVTAGWANPGLVDGSWQVLRTTLDTAVGAVTIQTSADEGATWTTRGSPAPSGAGAIFDGSLPRTS